MKSISNICSSCFLLYGKNFHPTDLSGIKMLRNAMPIEDLNHHAILYTQV